MTLSSSSWSTTIDRPANHGTSSRGSLRFGANRRKPSERDAPRLLSVHTDFVYGSDTYWWASTTASFRGNCFFKPSGINLDSSCPTRRWSFRSSGRRMTAIGRGCVKTPRQSHPRSRLQTQRETLLTGLRADNVLLVSN